MIEKKKKLILLGCVFLAFIFLFRKIYLISEPETLENVSQSNEKSLVETVQQPIEPEQPTEPEQPRELLQSTKNYFNIKNSGKQLPDSTVLIGFDGEKAVYYVMKDAGMEQLVFEYYSYDINSKENTQIYKTDECFTVLESGLFEDKLFFCRITVGGFV